MKKTVSVLLALLFAVLSAGSLSAAELLTTGSPLTATASGSSDFALTEQEFTYSGEDPIPLLVLLVSFDADGDGRDAYSLGLNTTDSSSAAYREQWTHSDASYWAKTLFGDTGATMKNYYKLMSDDNFWWAPIEETQGTVNDGIIYVTVKSQHPGVASGSSTASGAERITAIQAADEYVDFSKYDKNGDGALSWNELTVCYILGGRSTKFGMASDGKSVWGMGSYKQNGTSWYATCDGVQILNGGKGAKYCYVGEMQATDQPLSYGSIAHELGHVLGANDLYTYSGYTWCGGPSYYALQGTGSEDGTSKGLIRGGAPAAVDPYYLIDYGFQGYTVADNGEYTLYSRESTEGSYNIIRINTNNPGEYYLIENRYSTKNLPFDALYTKSQGTSGSEVNPYGILIWHVDEGIMKGQTLPNCWKGAAHAPGLTTVYASGKGGVGGYASAWSLGDVFDCRNYKFAGSDTWYTAMSDEEAENFNCKIEILSSNGNEMKIKVSELPSQPVYAEVSKGDITYNTLNLNLGIKAFNNNTVTAVSFSLFSDAEMTKAIVSDEALTPDEKGVFKAVVSEGLEPKTKYYYSFSVTCTNGTVTETGTVQTNGMPIVNTDSYKVYLYQNWPASKKTFGITVKVGEELHYNLQLKKSNHIFCGWYLDEELTDIYDMAYTTTECTDFCLYSRWLPNTEASILRVKNATSKYEIYGVPLGELYAEPIAVPQEGKAFAGWFADEALTVPFDFAAASETAGEVFIYAKWEEASSVETAEITTAATAETVASASETVASVSETSTAGHTETEPVQPSEEKGSPAVVIILIAVAVIVAAGGAVILIRRKK